MTAKFCLVKAMVFVLIYYYACWKKWLVLCCLSVSSDLLLNSFWSIDFIFLGDVLWLRFALPALKWRVTI